MPFELQTIRAMEFVRVGPGGRLEFKTSKETFATLARACRKRGLNRALLDLRSLPVPTRPLFTHAELADLVGTFREVGFGKRQRLAVLYQSDPHHGARRFAFISRMRGWHVRSSEDFEPALLWLSAAETQKRSRPEGQSIPIRLPNRGVAFDANALGFSGLGTVVTEGGSRILNAYRHNRAGTDCIERRRR